MSTNKVICNNIAAGPSRSTLIDAFKYALNKSVKMPVKFTCPGKALSFTYSATILGLEYESRKNDSIFKITGTIGLMGGISVPFFAIYDARKQTGKLVHCGGKPVCADDLLNAECDCD